MEQACNRLLCSHLLSLFGASNLHESIIMGPNSYRLYAWVARPFHEYELAERRLLGFFTRRLQSATSDRFK